MSANVAVIADIHTGGIFLNITAVVNGILLATLKWYRDSTTNIKSFSKGAHIRGVDTHIPRSVNHQVEILILLLGLVLLVPTRGGSGAYPMLLIHSFAQSLSRE